MDLAESLTKDGDWKPVPAGNPVFHQPDEFFLFDHDPQTGLGNAGSVSIPQFLASLARPEKSTRGDAELPAFRGLYIVWLSRRGHGIYGLAQRLFRRGTRSPGISGRVGILAGEDLETRPCTDARIAATAACPSARCLSRGDSCSKCGRNGPCGGSANGRCELDNKECIWARIYERLKSYGESQTMLDGPLVFYDDHLDQTSSWANFYLRRDHFGERTYSLG